MSDAREIAEPHLWYVKWGEEKPVPLYTEEALLIARSGALEEAAKVVFGFTQYRATTRYTDRMLEEAVAAIRRLNQGGGGETE